MGKINRTAYVDFEYNRGISDGKYYHDLVSFGVILPNGVSIYRTVKQEHELSEEMLEFLKMTEDDFEGAISLEDAFKMLKGIASKYRMIYYGNFDKSAIKENIKRLLPAKRNKYNIILQSLTSWQYGSFGMDTLRYVFNLPRDVAHNSLADAWHLKIIHAKLSRNKLSPAELKRIKEVEEFYKLKSHLGSFVGSLNALKSTGLSIVDLIGIAADIVSGEHPFETFDDYKAWCEGKDES